MNISETVTEKVNNNLLSNEVAYGYSNGIFTFDLGPFRWSRFRSCAFCLRISLVIQAAGGGR